MFKRPWLSLGLLLVGFTMLACVTINVYFPEAAVKDLSEKIEDAVEREAAQGNSGADAGSADSNESAASLQSTSGWRDALDVVVGTTLHLLAPAPVYAQTDEVAAPEISNPAIRKIIQSRAARVQQLSVHKASGALGENSRALVEVRSLDALGLQERAAVQKLVRAENADRERMFKEIAAATGTDLSQLPQIRSTYATTLRNKAKPGAWIQMPDGTWRQK